MSFAGHPADDNVHHLRQGIELIRGLDDATFVRRPDIASICGVGSQYRHCIDFYRCFLDGLPRERVDYNARQRDPGVEAERGAAIRCTEELVDRLSELDPQRLERPLDVRAEGAADGDAAWCRSSGQRELQFLVSHTVHHYALIVALLKLQGIDLAERFAEFGVARSTLEHWRETGASPR